MAGLLIGLGNKCTLLRSGKNIYSFGNFDRIGFIKFTLVSVKGRYHDCVNVEILTKSNHLDLCTFSFFFFLN